MNNLAKIRGKLGISQRKLGNALGWTQSRIANYETGLRTPSLQDVYKLVEAFKRLGVRVQVCELFPPVDEHSTPQDLQ